jgi:RNA polymerase sigma factor (sigma-70 family)
MMDEFIQENVDLNSIYQQEFRLLSVFLRKLCRDDDQAEDIAQEVFIKIFSGNNSYRTDEKENLRSYIYKAGYNTFLNHIKSESARKKREVRYSGMILSMLSFNRNSHEGEDIYSVVYDLLKNNPSDVLSEISREILSYRIFSPMNTEEIIKATGLSRRSYFRELKKCYSALKDSLEQSGYSYTEFL